MRKMYEVADPNSCFNRAKDEENVFVLLGRDAAAPATIRFWCNERVAIGKNTYNDKQICDALELADQIEAELEQKEKAEGEKVSRS